MNAGEKLEAAAAKLEGLRAAAFPGEWGALGSGARNGDHWYVLAEDRSIATITSDTSRREPTAVLINILHRTIEPQIAILRLGVRFAQIGPNSYTNAAVDLASSILGGDE